MNNVESEIEKNIISFAHISIVVTKKKVTKKHITLFSELY